ncbi:O-methyltransferase [bacterium]|nr:O-methyltransferase [bacterium]
MIDKINEYIDSFIEYPSEILGILEKAHQERINVQPNITKQGARLLYCLILFKKAKSVLEIGTCLGYSAIWAGEALRKTGGRLTTIEIDERFVKENVENIKQAKLDHIIEVVNGDAKDYLEKDSTRYDLIIIDSNKPLYNKIIDRCIDLLNPKGIIFSDDTLFLPMGYKERLAKPMDEYNKYVMQHPKLETVILPVGDGITISFVTQTMQ